MSAFARSALVAAVLLALPLVVKSDVALTILVFSFLQGMLAVSFNLIFGFTGQLSMFHAAAFGVAAYATHLSMQHLGVSFWTGMLLAAGLVSVLSVIVGSICFRFRLKEFYFAVVTLAFSEMARLTVLNWNSVTNGSLGINLQEKPTLWLPGAGLLKVDDTLSWYYLSLVALGITLLVCWRMVHSWMGRCFAAIRLERRARRHARHQCLQVQAHRLHRRKLHRRTRGEPVRVLPRLDRARLPVDRPISRHRRDGAPGGAAAPSRRRWSVRSC